MGARFRELRLGAIRLEMTAEFGMADDAMRLQIHHCRCFIVAHRRQMIAAGMSTSMVVPLSPDFQNVVELLFANHAECVQHFVLERLDHPLDECLQVR